MEKVRPKQAATDCGESEVEKVFYPENKISRTQ
jgi:hypothetical protein